MTTANAWLLANGIEVEPIRESAYIGCGANGVACLGRDGRQGRHAGRCSCGWEGPRRRKSLKALEDLDWHLRATDPNSTPSSHAKKRGTRKGSDSDQRQSQ